MALPLPLPKSSGTGYHTHRASSPSFSQSQNHHHQYSNSFSNSNSHHHSSSPSFSLTNSTHPLPPASHHPPPASAAVTRILEIKGFSASLKTRDLHAAFAPFDVSSSGAGAVNGTSTSTSTSGGGAVPAFRIKWVDDTSALVVFVDPIICKRAYLGSLLNPPKDLKSPVKIRPYDAPDAQNVIQTVSARAGAGGLTGRAGAAESGPGGVGINNTSRHGHRASFSGTGRSGVGFSMGLGGSGAMGSFNIPPPNAASASLSTLGAGAGAKHGRSSSVSTLSRTAGSGGSNAGHGSARPAGDASNRHSVASSSSQSNSSTLTSRMRDSGLGSALNGLGSGIGHHRANSASGGSTSAWGKTSTNGVMGGFGGEDNQNGNSSGNSNSNSNVNSGGHDRMGTFRFGTSHGGPAAGPGLTLPPLSSSSKALGGLGHAYGSGSRLSTHLEVETPTSTPMKPSSSQFSNSNTGANLPSASPSSSRPGAPHYRSSSAQSNRSDRSYGSATATASATASTSANEYPFSSDSLLPLPSQGRQDSSSFLENEEVLTPGLDILGAQPYAEGGPGGYQTLSHPPPQAQQLSSVTDGGRRVASAGAVTGTGTGTSTGASASASMNGNDRRNGNNLSPHIRRESMDAASAEKALKEVSKALQGLGVDS